MKNFVLKKLFKNDESEKLQKIEMALLFTGLYRYNATGVCLQQGN
jgi:hypothetical protein